MKPKIVIFTLCMLTWLGLTWSVDRFSLIMGVLTSLFVAFYTWDMFNPRFSMKKIVPRTIAFIEYFFVFFWECFKANIDVAYRVSHPAVPVHPGIVKVKTSLKSDLGLTFLANSITLTPGTMTIDIDREKGILYIHWIEVKDKDIDRATKRICGRFESILRRVFE